METVLVYNACITALQLLLPFVIACVVAGVLTSLFSQITRIDDKSIAVTGKIIALGLVFLTASGYFLSLVTEYARILWSGAQGY